MKSFELKIDQPCSENWQDMTSRENGSFCSACQKTVIDLTMLSKNELSAKFSKKKAGHCVRISEDQMSTLMAKSDFFDDFSIPFSSTAATVFIAGALLGPAAYAEDATVSLTHLVDQQTSSSDLRRYLEAGKSSNCEVLEPIVFKGTVTSESNNEPIENAKIIFISQNTVLVAYTDSKGSFKLPIPENQVNAKNLVRMSFDKALGNNLNQYGDTDFIYTREELIESQKVKAQPKRFILGYVTSTRVVGEPLALYRGNEIDFKDLRWAISGKKGKFNLNGKTYEHFNPEISQEVFGKKAKYGLYVVIDETLNH
ncbi:peptidase associated/transthyretin-like domain-containing protein [Nonlabens agnitus]|uniref:Carboxypeptidase regulatory-like domain-containing protein n=1 Tax=Nonlabens agnitus TaxID=870484 RepID=A0A2S9WS34_9FLAO|nr:hypothetical protein [Nonlabens agnitus]PRP66302.1 hypothetical protein BST86_03950 [Nonlabens agnitus]